MTPPAVERVYVVIAQRENHAHRHGVRIEVVEKAVVLGDQPRDRIGDGSLEKDGERVADFIFAARPARAEGKDLFKLIEDQVGDVSRLGAVVQPKPEAAGEIVG